MYDKISSLARSGQPGGVTPASDQAPGLSFGTWEVVQLHGKPRDDDAGVFQGFSVGSQYRKNTMLQIPCPTTVYQPLIHWAYTESLHNS